MTQGKLEVVRQEMARVIIGILGLSELKWISQLRCEQRLETVVGRPGAARRFTETSRDPQKR